MLNSYSDTLRQALNAAFSLVVLIVTLALTTGCSAVSKPQSKSGDKVTHTEQSAPNSISTAARFEQRLFKLTSDYYCTNGDWPRSWSDLLSFATKGANQNSSAAAPEWLNLTVEPTLSSARAIALTVSYTNQSGVKRRANFIAPPSCGDDDAADSAQEQVSVAGGGVRFKLPGGYKLINPKELKQRWKTAPFPDAGWEEGEDHGVLIALRFSEIEANSSDLAELSEEMADAYEISFPSIIWSAREERVIGGKPYIYQAFQGAAASSGDAFANSAIESVVLAGIFHGRLFSITVTAPVGGADLVTRTAMIIEDSLRVR
jgi:hypothetical protein